MLRDNSQETSQRFDGGFLVDHLRGGPHRRGERFHGPIFYLESNRRFSSIAIGDEEHQLLHEIATTDDQSPIRFYSKLRRLQERGCPLHHGLPGGIGQFGQEIHSRVFPWPGGRRDRTGRYGPLRLRDDRQVQAVRFRALQDSDENVGKISREIVDLRGIVSEESARQILSLYARNVVAFEGWPRQGYVRCRRKRYRFIDRLDTRVGRGATENIQQEG